MTALLPAAISPQLKSLETPKLPLSWSFNDAAAEQFHFVTLPSGAKFVYAAELTPGTTLAEVAAKLKALGGNVVVRGCSAELAEALGGDAVQLGSSARLDLDGYRPPHKVRNLAKRGAKAIAVREVPVTDPDGALARTLAQLRRSEGKGLQYLFRTSVADAQRAFGAFAPGAAEAAALVTLTRYGDGAWHLELMCRAPDAPQGAMEHLLAQVIETLQRERAHALNLGEVGLDFAACSGRTWCWFNRVVAWFAPLMVWLVRARYDVAGLHRFKNKFEPVWEQRFFVSTGRLGLGDLVALCTKCGIRELL